MVIGRAAATWHPFRLSWNGAWTNIQQITTRWSYGATPSGLASAATTVTHLTLPELREAFEIFQCELNEWRKGEKLDLLGANACAMSYAEAAYELRNAAEYLVASEITMPFAGWPYAAILQQITPNRP